MVQYQNRPFFATRPSRWPRQTSRPATCSRHSALPGGPRSWWRAGAHERHVGALARRGRGGKATFPVPFTAFPADPHPFPFRFSPPGLSRSRVPRWL